MAQTPAWRSAVANSAWKDADERDRLWLVLAVCALALILGYLLKIQCTTADWAVGEQYQRLCYNDIQPLYGVRGIQQHIFPYVHGELVSGELTNGAIEYPVLTGVFMWLSGLPVDNQVSYLRLSALLLAPFALGAAALLEKMRGLRALLWAGAPALVLYSFHNWDLLVVAVVILGFWLAERRRPEWAAVAFGVGAAFKMYPLLFVAPLAAWCLRNGGIRKALGVVGAGAGTLLLINLPFMVANPNGWLITYQFHSERTPNFDTIWSLGFEAFGWQAWAAETLNFVTTTLMIVTIMAALAYGWSRAKREGEYPFLQVSAAMLVGFLLFNKVHSPQYTLWLLPFFILLPVRWYWWAAYAIADLAVYVGIFRWFYDWNQDPDLDKITAAKGAVMAGVWGRALLLAALFVVFSRCRKEDGPELTGAHKVSQPRPSLEREAERPT